MGRLLIDLNSKCAQNPYKAGGKGAGLSRLVRHGFRVPQTYILPTHAFRSIQIQQFRKIKPHIEHISEEQLGDLKRHIANTPLPSPVQTAVAEAYAGLGDKVAVRSSMVGEDSCSQSFAGQLDSYLNLEDEQSVMEAVQKCWASSFNWRLWKYQKMQGQSLHRLRKILSMAVIIQDMVDGEVSGVAFSSDPIAGTNDVIIEAVPGLGDALVQGRTVPRRYIVSDSDILKQIPTQAETDSPLSQERFLFLAGIVRKIAAACGIPQDIEWTWDGHDFYILQSRPITALPDKHVYSSRLIADMSPGLVKPLLWSTKSRSMVRCVFGRISRELLGSHQIDFATYIKRIHSRIYADMTSFSDFLTRLGLPPNFFEMITRHEKSQRRLKILHLKKIPLLFRLGRFAFRHLRAYKKIAAFIPAQSLLLEPFRKTDWEALSPPELLDLFDQLMELHQNTQWYVFIGPLNMTLRYRLLGRLLKRLPENINPGNLLKGIEGLIALAPNSQIRQMSMMARDLDEKTLDLIIQGNHKKLEKHLGQTEQGQQIWKSFQNFLSRFGFLSANGSDFSMVSWNEDPSPVWRSIGRLAQQNLDWDRDGVVEKRDNEVIQIRRQLKGPQRILFDRLNRSIVRYMKLRESTSLIMSEETYLMRCALWHIAIDLKKNNHLAELTDIFYLYYDELYLWLKGNLEDSEVEKRIEIRISEMTRDASINPPDIIIGEQPLPLMASLNKYQYYLEGIPGSPGKFQGKARIVKNPNDRSVEVNPDVILVVPFTDVGWTPLLSGIGGIIAETGGQLSHTSIIAREYGLPSVVSVRDATRKIRNGQPITIDGDNGRVYLDPI